MIIRAGTSSFHTVSFFDEYSTPVVPSAGTYSVKDIYSDTMVKTSTGFTPATPWHVLEVTDVENAVVDPEKLLERRLLHVGFTYGGTKKGVADQVFVINAFNVTVEDVMTDLDGWVLNTVNPSRYDVTEDMVETYIVKAMIKASQAMGLSGPNSLPTDSETVDDAILDWAAGLLWKWRYTVNSPNLDLLPYGEELINDARSTLTAYVKNNPDLINYSSSGIGASVNENLGEFIETAEYYKTQWDELLD